MLRENYDTIIVNQCGRIGYNPVPTINLWIYCKKRNYERPKCLQHSYQGMSYFYCTNLKSKRALLRGIEMSTNILAN